jgi:hydrogenase maturation protease
VTRTGPTLVLGFGNASRADDGIGPHAIEYLLRDPYLTGHSKVTLFDGGTSTFELLEVVEQYSRLIVIDAAELQAAPGTVCCFLNEAMDLQLGRARRTAHEVALRDLLDIARLRDVLPADRALVGIQPETIAWRASLSETAVAALPVVRGTICELLLYWDQAG